ncbi:MAG TPA: LPD38 domain-containing protein, partial [Rhodanobacteraceae bacterium]|nr:LPD38 domain-containing protein [Rhodanobacteraceae bacterium]
RLQALGMKLVQDGKPIAVAANTMRAVKVMAGDKAPGQGDIFGFDDSAIREAVDMARVASTKQRELGEQIAAVSGAAKRPEQAKALGVNVKDPAAVQRRVEELKAERAEWDNWASNPRLMGEVRSELGLGELPPRPDDSAPTDIAGPADDMTASMFSRYNRGTGVDDMFGAPHEPERAVPKSTAATGDLFGGPTARDHLGAAERTKDAQRNGLAGGREDVGDGGLFDGARPEQVDLGDIREEATSYGDTHPLLSRTERDGVADPGAAHARRRAADAVQGGQLDLFTVEGHPVPERAAATLLARAKVVATGVFQAGIERIRDWQDAAHIIAPLRKSPQEQMLAVVADANGKPLAVLRHSMGTINSSSVEPGTVMGAIAQIPGAKQAWFGHNHPSGAIGQSNADRNITNQLRELMRGSGIEAHGMIVVGPNSRTATYYHPDEGFTGEVDGNSEQHVTPAARRSTVPVVERQLRKVATGDRVQARHPHDMAGLVRKYGEQDGVILLDNHHRDLGFIPLSDAEMSHLRTGDVSTGAAHVMRLATEAGAAAVIPVTHDTASMSGARNVNAMFNQAGLRPLDIAQIDGRSINSVASYGGRLTDSVFFSRDASTGAHANHSTDQVRDAARKGWGSRFITKLERAGILHFVTTDEAVARGLAKSADELAGVKGLYADGKAYVLTDQVRDLADVPGIVVHEAGLHYGYDRLTKPEERQALRNRVNRALAAGDADIVKAWQHAEKVGTPAKALHEEAMAYLAENAPGHDVVTRMVDAVKRGLNRLGVPLDVLESNTDAIRRTARDMLRRAANPEAHAGRSRVDADGVKPWRASTIDGAPVFSRDLLGSDDSQTAKARQQAAIARQSVLSQLAAQGYGQGALGWTGNPNEYSGWRGGVQKAMAALSDKMDPVRRAEQAIMGATGRSIADDADAYRLENLMHGRAADRLDALDRTAVKPLMKSMKQQGISPKLLMDYLYARHAPERNARIASINPAMPDGGSGLSTQQAQDILAGRADGVYSGQRITPDNQPKLQALAARVDHIRDQTLATLENSGQITPALAASLRTQWQHYVPLRGKEGDADTGPRGAGRGVDIKGKPIKRALGRGDGNTAPPNILAEIVGDAQRAIIQAEKARVGRAVLKLAAEHPNPDVWQVEPVDLEWKYSDSTGEAYLATHKPSNDKDVLTVVHEGTPYHVRLVDPRIRDAVLNLGAEQAAWLVNTLGKFNRWISAVSTRYNPAFTPINAIRDMTMGMTGLMAEHGPRVAADAAKLYLPAMRASWRDARSAPGDASVPNAQKSMDDWAREFAAAGGKTGIVHFNDIEDTTRHLEDSFKSGMELLGDLRPLAAAGKSLERLAPIVHVVEHANDAVENALRLASYVALRKRGMSVDRAAAYAKDLTVNFNRKGQWAGVLNSLYLFYNASAQGVRRGVKLMRNPKVAAFLGSLAALQAAQTAVLMSRKGDDGVSDWDAIPDWKKQRSLLIALPGRGNYFALPMPYEFGFMTFAGGRLVQAAMDDDPAKRGNLVNDLGVGLLGSFSPIPLDNGPTGLIPEAIKVPLQLSANKNDFGRRITNEQPYAPYDMPRIALGKDSTAAPYIWLAKALNRAGGGDDFHPPVVARGLLDWSPEDLQYLSNTFTGGLG